MEKLSKRVGGCVGGWVEGQKSKGGSRFLNIFRCPLFFLLILFSFLLNGALCLEVQKIPISPKLNNTSFFFFVFLVNS